MPQQAFEIYAQYLISSRDWNSAKVAELSITRNFWFDLTDIINSVQNIIVFDFAWS